MILPDRYRVSAIRIQGERHRQPLSLYQIRARPKARRALDDDEQITGHDRDEGKPIRRETSFFAGSFAC